MTNNVVERGGRFQLRVKHRLLPRPFFHTFDTEAEAATYRDQLKVLLGAGINAINAQASISGQDSSQV